MILDVQIGQEFRCGDSVWRCTDKGSRIITAIRVDSVTANEIVNGDATQRILTKTQAEADGWFNGPPYAVVEVVFDEYDQQGCSLCE